MTKKLAVLLFLAGLGLLVYSYRHHDTEDFMYYYCKGWVDARGRSPYELPPFQDCLSQALGRTNPNITAQLSSAYPPKSFFPFGLLSRFGYRSSYILWNFILICAGALLLAALEDCGGSWGWLILLSSPGFILCWADHKMTILLVCAWWWAIRFMERGDEAAAGAFMAFLSVQPHWFLAAGIFAAARKQRRMLLVGGGLAGAVVTASLLGGGWNQWIQWAHSIQMHSVLGTGLDNQSLFAGLYKPFRNIWPGPTAAQEGIRYALSAGLMILAVMIGRSGDAATAWSKYSIAALLALPYSHGSDALWTFPAMLGFVRDRKEWKIGIEVASILALQIAWAAASGFYAPKSLGRFPYDFIQGYWTLLIAGMMLYLDPGFRRRNG